MFPQEYLKRMTRGKNAQQGKEPETVVPATDLMGIDINKNLRDGLQGSNHEVNS